MVRSAPTSAAATLPSSRSATASSPRRCGRTRGLPGEGHSRLTGGLAVCIGYWGAMFRAVSVPPVGGTGPEPRASFRVMSWTEADSALYRALAAVAVPDRVEQMAALLTLLPLGTSDAGRVVELGCGEGRLAAAILGAYPQVRVLALDGSEDMRAQTTSRLESFGGRGDVGELDLHGDGLA